MPKTREKHKFCRIGLTIGAGGFSPNQIRHGVRRFATGRTEWLVREWLPQYEGSVEALLAWKPDGLIVRGSIAREQLESLRKLQIPTVWIHRAPFEGPYMFLDISHESAGRLAAGHFQTLGYRHFAAVGFEHTEWSDQRLNAFCEELPHIISKFFIPPEQRIPIFRRSAPRPSLALQKFFRELPKPCGVFCVHDTIALEALDDCRLAEIGVPDELAILGANDYDALCEMTRPQLSSVRYPWEHLGYLAAEWLDRILLGEPLPGNRHLVLEAEKVVQRQSTDIAALQDPVLAEALRYIQQHACDPLDVNGLLEIIPINRRRLERGFRVAIGRSPHEEIRRVQMEHAKRVLGETNLSIPEVADRVGLSESHFPKVFKAETGMTPSEYRKTLRSGFHDDLRTVINLEEVRGPEGFSARGRDR